jgi:hypothetical protein
MFYLTHGNIRNRSLFTISERVRFLTSGALRYPNNRLKSIRFLTFFSFTKRLSSSLFNKLSCELSPTKVTYSYTYRRFTQDIIHSQFFS